MADEDSERGSSFFNANTFFAILTLFGGVWLVSHKLTSSRPVVPAGEAESHYIGEQQLEARLWEDPFKALEKEHGPEKNPAKTLDALIEQISSRTSANNPALLMPAFIDGGNFAEDREGRLRTRYAVISALGSAGYVPEDPNHLGVLTIAWPNESQLSAAIKKEWDAAATVWTEDYKRAFGEEPASELHLYYEWFRPRTLVPPVRNTPVLLLWLDEGAFGDHPLLRLTLLLQPLEKIGDAKPRIAVMGPRGSATLRAMIPSSRTKTVGWRHSNPELFRTVQDVLSGVELYCATASVLDEALTPAPDPTPRLDVSRTLTTIVGFKSFQNFASTGTQLAREMYDELALRNVRLNNPRNHLVLISEWDTYYGRTLSIAYESQLYALQQTNRSNDVEAYMRALIGSTNARPANFHPFAYLRGLDGQTIGVSQDDSGKEHGKKRLGSFEDLSEWQPDENESLGPGQFDYLKRLGDQLMDLERSLQREDAHIKAIGIVGSDVYDTLLILQALRKRFDGALFFTTDLDARMASPRERDWARNLLVVSPYGLSLNPLLQNNVPAFRDGTQTAQYAATLAAMGQLSIDQPLRPRRFEIGNHATVDLSITNVTVKAGRNGTNWVLHPDPQEGRQPRDGTLLHVCVFAVAILFGLFWLWDPLWRLSFGYPAAQEQAVSTITRQALAACIRRLRRAGARPAKNEVSAIDDMLKAEGRRLAKGRLISFWIFFAIFICAGIWVSSRIWVDNGSLDGERLSFGNGTSAWPAEILRLLVCLLGIWFCIELSFKKHDTVWVLSRKFQFSSTGQAAVSGCVDVEREWRTFCAYWFSWRQVVLIVALVFAYRFLAWNLFSFFDTASASPVRGDLARAWNQALQKLSLYSFLALTMATIVTVLSCRKFVLKISRERSRYSRQTLDYFARQNGNVRSHLLDEWIDLHLIADLTDRVGKLVYYPCWLILLMWLARSNWFESWQWPVSLVVIYVCNFVLALASIFLLCRASKAAQQAAVASLTAKLKFAKSKTKTAEENDAEQGEDLLDEIRKLKRGAFVPFWENPGVGAFFVSSGSLTLLQLLYWFAGR